MKAPEGSRFYGGTGTIHATTKINVETDITGKVVAVWFRCQPLPFDQTVVEKERAAEMDRMYEGKSPTKLVGVTVLDD